MIKLCFSKASLTVTLSFSGGSVKKTNKQKNGLPMQETQVWSLGQEDSLEKETQPTPVFLPGESPG